MALFKRNKSDRPPPRPPVLAGLPQRGEEVAASLRAHSTFVKRATCQRCGSPKTLPSATAYLYCDFCGALVDYDFRIANADTNAGITNTVFHRLMAPVQPQIDRALATGDQATYGRIFADLYREWLVHCPEAASPRARTDADFRERFVAYCAACTVAKDFDPNQREQNQRLAALTAALQRIPTPDGAWRVVGPFWEMADLFRTQMAQVYAGFESSGVAALDPDDPPPGVALKLEYSTFCQGWLPHLSPEDGDRLLREFGLTGDYTEYTPVDTETHACGGCGGRLTTVVGARVVVCESCGRRVDIAAGSLPCHNCGADLSFPEGSSHLACPFCGTQNQRV